MRARTSALLAAMLIVLASGLPAAAKVEPAPATHVDDRAGLIDAATEDKLLNLLRELEEKTGARIIVVTVQTTGGQDIHDFTFERADTWTFGENQTSASALMVLAKADRKYRIEVGYDWEPVLTDGFVGQVGRDYLVPHFRAGRTSRGVYETAAALARKVADERGVTLTGMPALRPVRRRAPALSLCGAFVPLIFFFVLFGLARGRRRGRVFWGLMAASMLMGGRSGGFGGRSGGFGGGFGGGGFGGGGGGGFGGGGASGGW
ncbi:MAG: TPM domain-containing protein [Planctomycetota bacterium]